MYDVIVVGARCAGAATAMLLARRGHEVLLVDRARLPSEIPHGHFLHRGGPRRLHDWGLLDRVIATGAPPVTRSTMLVAGVALTATGLEAGGVPFGIGPRRAAFDLVLAEAAAEAGAEVRDGFAVHEYLRDGDRVAGVAGRETGGGRRVRKHARMVVGADGRNSGLARAVRARVTAAEPTATCWYFSYWSGTGVDALEMRASADRVLFAFPTNDELTGVFAGWPLDELPRVRADVGAALAEVLGGAPELAQRVAAGTREERYLGATQLPNFLRRPHGPGWALVGDAGAHKDPFMALGMCDALRDAELLADALDRGLTGAEPMELALAGYEHARDEATRPDFWANLSQARFEPAPPEYAALRRALSHADPEDVRAFHLANQGLIAREAFYNDETLRRVMATA